MSKFGAIAAGLLGGFGQGLTSVSQSRAKAEIEEAKELRQRAFAKEMYEQQRADQLTDMETKRGWELDDQSTADAIRMGELAVADEKERRRFNADQEYRDETLALQRNQFDLQVEQHDQAVQAARALAETKAQEQEVDIWQGALKSADQAQQELNELRANAAEIMTDSPEKETLLQAIRTQEEVVRKRREEANLLQPEFVKAKSQKAQLDEQASSIGISTEKLVKIAKEAPTEDQKIEIAKKFINNDPEANHRMIVWEVYNPELHKEIVAIRDKLQKDSDLDPDPDPKDVSDKPKSKITTEEVSSLTQDSPSNKPGLLSGMINDIDMQIRNTEKRLETATGAEKEKLELLLSRLKKKKNQ